MSGVNRVILVGHLGIDPKQAQVGELTVADLSLATSHRSKGDGDEPEEKTTWHRVTVFGQAARYATDFCKKGDMIYLEGRMAVDTWTDKEGQTRYTHKVIASKLQKLRNRNPNERPASVQEALAA